MQALMSSRWDKTHWMYSPMAHWERFHYLSGIDKYTFAWTYSKWTCNDKTFKKSHLFIATKCDGNHSWPFWREKIFCFTSKEYTDWKAIFCSFLIFFFCFTKCSPLCTLITFPTTVLVSPCNHSRNTRHRCFSHVTQLVHPLFKFPLIFLSCYSVSQNDST